MQKRTVLIGLLFTIIVLGMNFPLSFGEDIGKQSGEQAITSKLVLTPSKQLNENFWYRESAGIWIGTDGWWTANVWFAGAEIELQGLDADLLPSLLNNKFVGLYVFVSDNTDPFSDNLYLRFDIKTNDPLEAEQLSQQLLNALSAVVSISATYRNSEGSDWYDGSNWVQITHVYFGGHVDWTDLTALIDASLPREHGGLAATIDITDSTNLAFSAWLNVGDQSVSGEIGIEFSSYLPLASSSYNISLASVFRVAYFEQSSLSTSSLDVWATLPNVSGLTINPGNQTNVFAKIDYHPSSEPNDEQAYVVSWSIEAGTQISDLSLSFNHQFKPWAWVQRDEYSVELDGYGFAHKYVGIWGKARASPTTALFVNSTLMKPVHSLRMYLEPDHNSAYKIMNPTGRICVQVLNSSNSDTVFSQILQELNSLGINFTYSGNYWYDQYTLPNGTTIVLKNMYANNYNLTRTEYEAFLNNAYFTLHSTLQGNPMITTSNKFYWSINTNQERDYKFSNVWLEEDPLFVTVQTPQPLFSPGSGTWIINLTDSASSPFGFSEIPWHPELEKLSLRINTPITTELDQIAFVPSTNNGWGWWSWREINQQEDERMLYWGVEIVTDTPMITDMNGNNVSALSEISIQYQATFFDPAVDDRFPPRAHLYTPDQPTYDPLSGVVRLRAGMSDVQSYVEDSNGNIIPRAGFAQSGIGTVTGAAYFNDAPVNHPAFQRPLNFVYNYTAGEYEYYDAVFDTSLFADGYWQFWVNITDNAGLWSQQMINLLIDNYPDGTTTPPIITWDVNTPANHSSVHDIVDLRFNVTDDVGIFAVVLWIGAGGYVLNETTKGSGMYEFAWDTAFEPENFEQTIMVEVYDMDGFRVQSVLKLVIDNRPAGNPPVVTIISPEEGITHEATSGPLLFALEIDEDVGIQEAWLEIDGRAPLLLDLNNQTGYYEVNLNTSQFMDGQYTYKFRVIDMDENQHEVVTQTRTFTITGGLARTGDPPVIQILSGPASLSQSELDQGQDLPDDKVATGEVTFVVRVSDDIGIAQVLINLPEIGEEVMTKTNTFGNGSEDYSYTWDSASVIDGPYTVVIKAMDIDAEQHTASLDWPIYVKNGRTRKRPDLGLPGFGWITAILPLFAGSMLLRRKKRK